MKFKSKEKMRCGPGSVLHQSGGGGWGGVGWAGQTGLGLNFAAVGFQAVETVTSKR